MSQHPDEDSPANSKVYPELDPKTVCQVLADHMKTLRSSTDWGITIATTTLLLAITGVEQTILGVTFTAKGEVWAYFTAAAIYLIVITMLGRQLLGLGYLLEVAWELTPPGDRYKQSIEFVVPVITYPWVFNPFTYCGGFLRPDHEDKDSDSSNDSDSDNDNGNGNGNGNEDRKNSRQTPTGSRQSSRASPSNRKAPPRPTPQWAQLLRNLAGSTGGVALIVAWWIGFFGLYLIRQEINIGSHWDTIASGSMALTGIFALFAIWKVLCILSNILIGGRPGRKDRLMFYEHTVPARLAALFIIQLAMISVSLLGLHMPLFWTVFPPIVVSIVLGFLWWRFRKKYPED